jgi:hypothetical protein
MIRVLFILATLSVGLAGCAGNTSVDGSGNSGGAAGRIKIGWPF